MGRKLHLPKGILDQVTVGDDEEWKKSHNSFNKKQSRKDRRKAQRLAKKGKSQKSHAESEMPQNGKKHQKKAGVSVDSDHEEELDDNMDEEETWAALKAMKNKKRAKSTSSENVAKKQKRTNSNDYENFRSAAELEKMRKDEQDAKYYAKMLGQKSLKLNDGGDGLNDLLGDLDFDRVSDLEGKSDSKSEDDIGADLASEESDNTGDNEGDSEPYIENPWKDDSLSEGDFDSDSGESEVNAQNQELSPEATMKALAKEHAKKTGTKLSKPQESTSSEADSDEFIENPWGKDDTLTESDFTDNPDFSDEEEHTKDDNAESDDKSDDIDMSENEPFIENPWTDDSLSEGDFDSDEGVDDSMTAEETMALLAKNKALADENNSARVNDKIDEAFDSGDFDSEEESLDDNMDEEETWAALRAMKEGNTPASGKKEREESLKESVKQKKTSSSKELKSKKENPYLPAGKNQAKYVPPSKRRLVDRNDEESEETIKLRRQLKGVFNKLTESNIGTIINEVEALFESNPKHLVGSIITKLVIEGIVSQGTLQEAFLVVHSGIVTALYKTIGVNFGAQFIQDLTQEFFRYYNASERNKDSSNILMLIMSCYTLGMVSSKLIYDFFNEFLNDVTETNSELLLLIIRTCGPQIRSDDPASLKEIIITLQKKMGSLDKANMTVRNKMLVESMLNLKNNKLKSQNEQLFALQQRMRKFLGTVHGSASEPLQVTLSDIRNIDTKGKWWIVGAAYNSGGGIDRKDQLDYDEKEVDSFITNEPNWLALARKQRLNTDVRRAIFIAIMGAEDFMDACMRVDKLRLKSKQEREIVHVILHCLVNEQVYNPYYALVAGKQCTKHTMRKAFQFQLWDYLNELQDSEGGDLSKAMHYARFYASLVAQGSVSLDILKVIDFLTGNETVQVFLEVFFVFLFKAVGKEAEAKASRDILGHQNRDARNLAKILSMTKEQVVLRGIQFIQPRVTNSAAFESAKKKEKERITWCSQMAVDLIDQLAIK